MQKTNSQIECRQTNCHTPLKEGTRVHLADYYQTYRYYAASRELLFIDYYPAWLEAFKDNPDLYKQYYVDTTHPNLEGTEAVIMPILREYIY